MAAITLWKDLVSDVHHVWTVEVPKEPSIWICSYRLLEVALQV